MMDSFFIAVSVTLGVILLAYATRRVYLFAVARGKLNRELAEVIAECQAVDERCEKGYGVFYPVEEKKKLFEELVRRKIMVHNRMSGDGYSFMECHKNLWEGMPPIISISPEKYEDPPDLDVIAWNKGKDGKFVPALRVVGNTIVDPDGKVVKQIAERKGGVQ
jgi:hypothetical protein